jgi:hypothetical protein
MREAASGQRWLAGVSVFALVTAIGGLAELARGQLGPPHQWTGELALAAGSIWTDLRSPTGVLLVTLASPLLLAAITVIEYGVGRMLGGRTNFTGLLATEGLATLPGVPGALLTLGLAAAGLGSGTLGDAPGWACVVWSLLLSVIGIQAALGLTLPRAVAVVALMPIVALGLVLPVALSATLFVLREAIPPLALVVPAFTIVVVLTIVKLFPPPIESTIVAE